MNVLNLIIQKKLKLIKLKKKVVGTKKKGGI
jgi:hypothetical protein